MVPPYHSLALPDSLLSAASTPALPTGALSTASLPAAMLSTSMLPSSSQVLPPSLVVTVEPSSSASKDAEGFASASAPPASEEYAAAAAALSWGSKMREVERVRFLARGYRVTGAPVGELCAHNASVAESAGMVQLSQAWQSLHYLLYDVPDAADAAAAGAESSTGAEPPSIFTASTAAAALAVADFATSKAAVGDLPMMLVAEEKPDAALTAVSSTGGGGAASAASAAAAAADAASATSAALFPAALAESTDGRRLLLESVAPVFNELLRHHADCGDAQTCFILTRTLQPVVPDLVADSLVNRWTLCYIEQLHKLQLFSLANDVIKQSHDEQISQINQRSTTINVGGGGASSSQGKPARAFCSVCQQMVKGLYVFCQACGHGGHIDCMRQWFERSRECPAGCGHICLLRPPSVTEGLG